MTQHFRRGARRRLAALVAVCGVALGVALSSAPRQRLVGGGTISPEALAQIETLLQEKASRTDDQRKIDSQLICSLKMARGESIVRGVQRLTIDPSLTTGNRLTLDGLDGRDVSSGPA